MKQSKWSTIKDGLFLYLAISKILYWINTITEVMQSDFNGAGILILNRVSTRELPTLFVVICLILIDVEKGNFFLKLAIAYIASLTALFSYLFILSLFMHIGTTSYWNMFVGFTFNFVIVAVILNIKYHFMEKMKKTPDEPE